MDFFFYSEKTKTKQKNNQMPCACQHRDFIIIQECSDKEEVKCLTSSQLNSSHYYAQMQLLDQPGPHAVGSSCFHYNTRQEAVYIFIYLI